MDIEFRKIDINERMNGLTPLMVAVGCGRTLALKFRLLSGADPNIVNDDKFGGSSTALHFAVSGWWASP